MLEEPRRREANRAIHEFARESHRVVAYFCECGATSCGLTTVVAEATVFADALATPGARLLAPGHETPGSDVLLAGDGYLVVATP